MWNTGTKNARNETADKESINVKTQKRYINQLSLDCTMTNFSFNIGLFVLLTLMSIAFGCIFPSNLLHSNPRLKKQTSPKKHLPQRRGKRTNNQMTQWLLKLLGEITELIFSHISLAKESQWSGDIYNYNHLHRAVANILNK